MNHIFVDYENIKRIDPAVLGIADATFTLLLGPQNRTLALEVVEHLMVRSSAVELVRMEEPGRNAVDFALVYYLARRVAADPTAHFHLISRDTGYDPLLKHLQGRGVQVSRHSDIDALAGSPPPARAMKVSATPKLAPAAKQPAPNREPQSVTPLLTRVLAHFQRNANSRPKREKTLVRQLASQFLKGAPPEAVEQLIATLVKSGHLQISEKGAITYHLDA